MRTAHVPRALSAGLLLVALLLGLHTPAHTASAQTFSIVNVEASGAKIWLPSVIAVHPGDQVTLKLDNKLTDPHGFSIDDYNIHVVVPAGGTMDVTFTAKQGLTSRFYCQLHPAHVGGEVMVVP